MRKCAFRFMGPSKTAKGPRLLQVDNRGSDQTAWVCRRIEFLTGYTVNHFFNLIIETAVKTTFYFSERYIFSHHTAYLL